MMSCFEFAPLKKEELLLVKSLRLFWCAAIHHILLARNEQLHVEDLMVSTSSIFSRTQGEVLCRIGSLRTCNYIPGSM